jgi:hypothetical protein
LVISASQVLIWTSVPTCSALGGTEKAATGNVSVANYKSALNSGAF